MARVRDAGKHPALAGGRWDALAREDIAEMKALRGWESFTPEEKRFLALYPWHRTKGGTAQAIGKGSQWLYKRVRKNPLFKEAVEYRSFSAVKIAMKYGQDIMGKSMLRLEELLDEKEARIRLESVKHLHTLMGLLRPEHPMEGFRGNYIKQVNINMFGRPKKPRNEEAAQRELEEAAAIEGELVKVGSG